MKRGRLLAGLVILFAIFLCVGCVQPDDPTEKTEKVTVSVQTDGNGTLTATPDGEVEKGTSVTVEIAADEGYELASFTVNEADKLILPEPAPGSRPSWFGFLISVRPESGLDRNAITRYVESHNVQTRLLFSGNLIKHPCFNELRGTDAYRVVGGLENTDFIMNNTFWVGVYPGMTDEMIDYMAKVILEAIE